jgi:hypothetical protein
MSLPALFLQLSVDEPTGVKQKIAPFKKDRLKYEEERQKSIQLARTVAAAGEEARRKEEEERLKQAEEERRKEAERQETERLFRSLEEGGPSNPREPVEGNEWFNSVAAFLLADSDAEDDQPMPAPEPPEPPEPPPPAPVPAPAPAPAPVLKVHRAFKKKPKPSTVPQTKPIPVDRKKVPVPVPTPKPPPVQKPPEPPPVEKPPEPPPVEKSQALKVWEHFWAEHAYEKRELDILRQQKERASLALIKAEQSGEGVEQAERNALRLGALVEMQRLREITARRRAKELGPRPEA